MRERVQRQGLADAGQVGESMKVLRGDGAEQSRAEQLRMSAAQQREGSQRVLLVS